MRLIEIGGFIENKNYIAKVIKKRFILVKNLLLIVRVERAPDASSE